MTLAELKQIINEKYLHRGDYTLSSGRKSNLYFDIKSMLGSANDLDTLLEELFQVLFGPRATINDDWESLGGLELGGAILAAAMTAGMEDFDNTCYIRKASLPREHGLKKMIEGQPKSPILLVDDVISTGDTIANGIRVCHKAGYSVAGVICVIDRVHTGNEVGIFTQDVSGLWFYDIKPIEKEKEYLKGLDLPVFSLFKESDFA